MFSRVIVAPPVEPLTLTEVKLDRAVEHSLHDDLLTALIKTARSYVEDYCTLSLIYQTRELILDAFSNSVEIPYGPVQSVEAIEYVDTNGITTTLGVANYTVNVNRYAAMIAPAWGLYFPATRWQANAVVVRYIAGYEPVGSPADYTYNVPAGIKTAMKLLIGGWYEHRESVAERAPTEVPMAVMHLLGQHRRSWL